VRLLERVKKLEAQSAPDTDWNRVCKELAQQTEMMLVGDGPYNPDDYLMPLWGSQAEFDECLAERRKDYERMFGTPL